MRLPPPSGQLPLPHVTELICDSEAFYGHPTSLAIKTIAARARADSWLNYGTVARLSKTADTTPFEPEVIELGTEVRLISHAASAEDIQSPDDLRQQLARWRGVLKAKTGFNFQERTRVRRHPSRNDWTDGRPCWVFELEEDTSDRVNENPPKGPFLNPEAEIFADEINTLAVRWLRCPYLSDRPQVRNEYRLVVSDPRPYLKELEARDQKLSIRVTRIADEGLYCGAAVTNLQGEQYECWAPVNDESGEAEIEFQGAVKELSLYLMLADGEWLDRYRELERSQSWDQSLFNEPREEIDPEYAELVRALDEGESESVEFKPWINAAKRDTKAKELLKSAVAFSNASGGYIFIGVDDHGEPDNLTPELERAYGAEARGDLPKMQDAYVGNLRRMLSEGVIPQIRPEFDWIKLANLPILRITIPRGDDSLRYVVAENRLAYIRAGATDRKLRDLAWTDLRPSRPAFPLDQGPSLPGAF